MTTIGVISAGEGGGQLARAAIVNGYEVVIANSRGPKTLKRLVDELGSSARAGSAADAPAVGDFAVIAVPLKLTNNMPVEELAGKIVLDANNYMPWRDGNFPEAGELVTRLHDQFGFDTVDNSPLSESWRSGPGQPAWNTHEYQSRSELSARLAGARRINIA